MTDLRDRRTAVLAAAAKAKSHAKAEAADQAIRRLTRRGEPVTFQAVQREAGVSHAFLYGNPELRARIEHLRDQARPRSAQPAGNDSEKRVDRLKEFWEMVSAPVPWKPVLQTDRGRSVYNETSAAIIATRRGSDPEGHTWV